MKKVIFLIFLLLSLGLDAQVLTPKAPDTPRINGARIYGQRPGAEFLYKIPATGARPMEFAAEGLPKGLKLDRNTGIISGRVKKPGTYCVRLKAKNGLGEDERGFRIVIGDRVALTPPMGWNSWNCWGHTVSQEKIISSAKALLDKGLDQYGWSYVNIDDGWQGVREGKDGALAPNSKFPDMKGLADFLHENGLKLGIYSGPWVGTYAGHIGETSDNEDGSCWWFEKQMVDSVAKLDRSRYRPSMLWYHGKYSFVKVDARQWAEWGVDFLKYDWSPNDYYQLKAMREALLSTGRDIVYSISNAAPVALGAALMEYSDLWRTSGDQKDDWKKIMNYGFNLQDIFASFHRPGSWPDADMLVIGKVGWGNPHMSRLTPDEQYSHVSYWTLLASPLLIGCDLADIDEFTLSLLTNSEVIDINQDELGLQACRVFDKDSCRIYLKPLADGTVAIGLFNLSEEEKTIGFKPFQFMLLEEQTVRDVWRQQDMAKIGVQERWETKVAPHGCRLLKLSPGIINNQPVGYNRYRKNEMKTQ